ncbi:MAG TPA: hypothetical protein VKK31_18725 [Thermoanaerobaculia bacterium]|nr:hypothetical protein [Thermoanaerobaculia bacterium]
MMKAHFTLTFALLLICTGAVLAQTPDGETPAEEAVCDNETGAAFGLCNAYCEAMDCESDAPQASDTACSKVRAKFQQTTGRDLPCEQVTCPCAEVEGNFANVLAGNLSVNSCSRSFGNSEGIYLSTIRSPLPIVFSGSQPDQGSTCGTVGAGLGTPLPISAEQDQACRQLLEQYVTSHGLTCTP